MIPPIALTPIRELYAQGLYRQALAAGDSFGPLRDWDGPAARLLAGRLAMQLGAPQLGRRLHLVAYRHSPAYPEAIYYHARYRLEHFGPLSAWRFMREHIDWSDAPPELRSDWLSLSAYVAARLRDFDRAHRLLAQAETLAPGRSWLEVERAAILMAEDRPTDALAAARRSLTHHPYFRPGVQAVGHLLQAQGQDEEAVEFLREAVQHLESGMVTAQLAALLIDLRRYEDARQSLDEYETLTPLREAEGTQWLSARRADVAYHCRNWSTAIAAARATAEEFYTRLADTLTASPPAADWSPPRLLAIPEAKTPVEAIARFWNHSLAPAADVTGSPADGLPDAHERRRFAGWRTQEFTLSLDAAVALIERGVPFLMTLVQAGLSQSKLIVGADPIRGSIFVAEPAEPRPTETPIQSLIERFRFYGPRCLVAVPPEQTAKLDGLPLPDADRYDALFEMQSTLIERKFADAKRKLTAILDTQHDHRLARWAKLAWAKATQHPVLILEAVQELRTEAPHDATMILLQAAALRELGRLTERTALLEAEAQQADADPVVLQSLAQVWLTDPHRHQDADRLLRRSLRIRPQAAAGYYLLATRYWDDGHFPEAVELFRIAACLDDNEEQFTESYAKAAREIGQGPDAIRLFQQRGNVKALFQTLLDRDETTQAFSALDRAITERTASGAGRRNSHSTESDARLGQGDLLLFRAEQHANFGRFLEAEMDLRAAKSLAASVVWLKSAARIARSRPNYREALGYIRDLLNIDALNTEAHRIAAGLIADTEGRSAAREYLDDVVQKYPGVYPLAKLRAEYVFRDPDDAAIAATQALIALCPQDAWAYRQLALVLADRNRHDDALLAISNAAALEPTHPSYYAVLGHVHRKAERTDDALAAFRAGIQAHPDHDLCIAELVSSCRGTKEKKNALRWIAGVLCERHHTGDGLQAYAEQAARLVEDGEDQVGLLTELERFLDRRPDLWQSWSLVIQQLIAMHRADEALSLARHATGRFPLSARLWADLAEAARQTDQPEERLDALRRTVACAPGWPPAAKELADLLAYDGDTDGAITTLTRLVAANPLDPTGHWLLAEQLWDAGRPQDALAQAKLSVRLEPAGLPDQEPRLDIAWGAVLAWSDRVDTDESPVDFARKLAADRSGDPRAWLRLARCLTDPDQSAEALAVLDTAIRLDPRNIEAHDLRAEKLAQVGRFEEALEAARPAALAANVPLVLQGRAAWVEARRGNYAAAIPPMQALVAVDPHYVWGWQQLAEWYNETGKSENYLEAASELTRLRPESPVPLAMRGEARLQTGDRDGGKEDLREVLRNYPAYSPAAAVLFDACLADGELREARSALAVLQEYLVGPEVVVKQLQYCLKTNDEDGAVRALTEIATHPNAESPILLQMALLEMRMGGLADRAEEVLRDVWSSGEPFNPWAAIYWLDTPDGEGASVADRLAACDAILQHFPDFIPGHDRRAEQLAAAGRFDDALAACRALQPVPIVLQGRAAWVAAQRGDKHAAIGLMRTLLEEEPDYAWGWRQLTHWYDATGQPRNCLHAAEHLVRLNPQDPLAHGIRGEARRAVGDMRGALADYQHAFTLDPNFEAAGLQLMAVQLSMDDLAGATQTLRTLRERGDGPLVKLRAIQLAVRQSDLAAARGEFQSLCRDASVHRSIVREAAMVLAEAGWATEVDDDFDQLITDPEANPAVAAIWAERTAQAGQPQEVSDRLDEIIEANPSGGREAILAYTRAMAEAGRTDLVAATVQRYAPRLREDDTAWARAGAALAEAKQWGLAAAWMGNWQARPELPAEYFRPLVDALLALGRDDEAAKVITSLDEPPIEFRAWLAIFAATEGRTDTARQLLEGVDRIGSSDGARLLLAMTEALVSVQQGGAFAEARETLRVAAESCASEDIPPGATRWWQRVVSRLAADAGTFSARLWAFRQRLAPWVKG